MKNTLNRRLIKVYCMAGTLMALNGCGLTDQQLASVWQSVITTGLTTLVSNLLSGAGTV